MIFIDANIYMYAAGSAHPCKVASIAFLRNVAAGGVEACTSAEILQELLHRYRSIGCWYDGATEYDLAKKIVPDVKSITIEIVEAARKMMDEFPGFMARDCIHAATCLCNGISRLCTFNTDFEQFSWIDRVTPDDVSDETA